MPDASRDAVFRPALILMGGRVLGFAVAFAIPLVLARLFSQAEFGSYKQLFLVYGTLLGIAQAGMAESLFYFLPKQRERAGSFVANTLLALAVSGLLCLAGLALLREPLAGLLGNPALAPYLPWLGLYLLFMMLSVLLEIVMTVRRQHRDAARAYALTDLLRALCYLAPLLFLPTLDALLFGALVFAGARLAATAVYARRVFPQGLRPDRKLLRLQLGYALPFGLAGMVEMLQTNYHLYAVSWHFDAATFALYAVGCLQVPLFDFLTSSTSNVMMTSMRERLLEGAREKAWSIWLDTTRRLALMLFPLVALLLALAEELIVFLFTAAYAASVPVFLVWTLSLLFTVPLTDGALRVAAETRFLILQNLVQLLFVALAIGWAIARFGLLGAVGLSVSAFALCKALALWRMARVFRVPLGRLLPWRTLGTALALSASAALPVWLLKTALELPPLAVLLCGGVLYAVVYLALLLSLGPLRAEERLELLRWLQRFPGSAFSAGGR